MPSLKDPAHTDGALTPAKLVFDGRCRMPVEVLSKPRCATCSSVGFGDVERHPARYHVPA
jgi:hypothetical protein